MDFDIQVYTNSKYMVLIVFPKPFESEKQYKDRTMCNGTYFFNLPA